MDIFNLQFIDWQIALQKYTWLEPIMWIFTYMGNPEFYFLFLPILLWCFSYHHGFRLLLFVTIAGFINLLLKVSFLLPRPYCVDPNIKAYYAASGLGMPSGHAQVSFVLWAGLAQMIKRHWFWVLAIGISIMIGLSRVFLGVHSPMQILVGWGFGIATLLLFIYLEKPLVSWFSKRSLGMQILSLFGISFLFIALGHLIFSMHFGWTPPQEWVTNYERVASPEKAFNPLKYSDLFFSTGIILGYAIGGVLTHHWGGFRVEAVWWKRVLRYPVGLVGMALMLLFLRPLLDDLQWAGPMKYIALYLGFMLPGIWITGIAPWLFKKIGLVEPLTQP